MKVHRILAVLLTLTLFLTSCALQNAVETDIYKGDSLALGIIGEPPEVRETNTTFVEIGFEDLIDSDFESKYDAIFITKENLSKAADSEFAEVYKTSNIPFFFIQTTKGYIPFVKEDLSNDDAPEVPDSSYITGIHYEKNRRWSFCLYNDIENSINIEDVYSRVFITISENAVST
ncbi:MAG: transcription elongation factor GreAB [Acetivibrionales bacterium]